MILNFSQYLRTEKKEDPLQKRVLSFYNFSPRTRIFVPTFSS